MNIYAWAVRHGISQAAIDELVNSSVYAPAPEGDPRSEAYVQSVVRAEAAQYGVRLWRNNVGAGMLESGSFVRWGLANDTKELNEVLKSSDLIGWRHLRITDAMVNTVVPQTVARECKPEGWQYTGTGREPAQLAFLNLINMCGGDARFVTGRGSFT